MKLSLHRADNFNADFRRQYRWYLEEASEEVAKRFLNSVELTLEILLKRPNLGLPRRFRNSSLAGFRSFRVEPPFHRILIFYRHGSQELIAERLMHGARDLPRRLLEP